MEEPSASQARAPDINYNNVSLSKMRTVLIHHTPDVSTREESSTLEKVYKKKKSKEKSKEKREKKGRRRSQIEREYGSNRYLKDKETMTSILTELNRDLDPSS